MNGYDIFICSDHGFTGIRQEVQLNRWLRQEGYLDCDAEQRIAFTSVRSGSRALALVPGRIHILRRSRWERGAVSETDYEPFRKEIIGKLLELRSPETGETVCRQVLRGEDVFSGPHVDTAPDIIIEPTPGYDLQARLDSGPVFAASPRSGMHTLDDALLIAGGKLAESLAPASSITELGRLLADHTLGAASKAP